MPSFLKSLLLPLTAVLALAGGYWLAQSLHASKSETAPTYGGGAMIDFTLPDLNGKKQSLSAWRGKVIVLNFWATWCPPCREEIPLFIDLQKKHAAGDLQIIGVAIDNPAAVRQYRQSAGMNYPILIGDDATLDLISRYGNRSNALPFTVIINRDGTIAARKLGAFQNNNELKNLIESVLISDRASAQSS